MDRLVKLTDQFLMYVTPDGGVRVEAYFADETIWLSQKRMAELFGVDVRTVSEHLLNIFESGELSQISVIRKIRTTANDSKSYLTNFYNLDAIIAVGYRVNSSRATQFRIWASGVLKEYLIKGFAMDDERLKQARAVFGKDYFDELLERVRSIRASERRIYQKITDIFAECSIDYDKSSSTAGDFFAMIQNKIHFAIIGETAAERIYHKADHKQPNMGLMTWKKSPAGRILLSDTKIAKNYLSEKEIKQLERLVSSYFDYIEGQIERKNAFTMEEFALSVDKFLNFNDYKILDGRGRVSAKDAEKKAIEEYWEFNKTQGIESDFDKMIKKVLKEKNG